MLTASQIRISTPERLLQEEPQRQEIRDEISEEQPDIIRSQDIGLVNNNIQQNYADEAISLQDLGQNVEAVELDSTRKKTSVKSNKTEENHTLDTKNR